MNRIIISIFLFIFFAFPLSAQQDYRLDTTFRATCEEFPDLRNSGGRTVIETPSGMIYLQGGGLGRLLTTPRYNGIQRYFPDGRLDTSFYFKEDENLISILFAQIEINWHKNQLYVVGAPLNPLTRLLDTGAIDTTFSFKTLNPLDSFMGARSMFWLTDSTFILSSGIVENGILYYVNINLFQMHGNVAIEDSSVIKFKTLRLPPFHMGAGIITIVKTGNKYLIGGDFPNYNGVDNTSCLFRIFDTGEIDTTFKSPIASGSGGVNSLMPLPNNKILVGATTGTYMINDPDDNDYAFFRLHPDGKIDTTFNSAVRKISPNQLLKIGFPAVLPILPTSDGGYFATGFFTTGVMDPYAQPRLMLKLDSNGFYDTRYLNNNFIDTSKISPQPTKYARNCIRLASGKILIIGYFQCLPPYSDYQNLIRIEEPDFQLAASDVEKEKALLKIYPNPASDELTIELPPNLQSSKLTLRLHNQLGQTVHSQAWREESPTQTISVASLPSGFYVVSVTNGAETWYQKVIIQR